MKLRLDLDEDGPEGPVFNAPETVWFLAEDVA